MFICASYLEDIVLRLDSGRSYNCNHSSKPVCILLKRQNVSPIPESLLLEKRGCNLRICKEVSSYIKQIMGFI